MGYSLPGFSVCGISQAKILGWVTISFSNQSFQPRDRTHISCIGRWILCHLATRDTLIKQHRGLFFPSTSALKECHCEPHPGFPLSSHWAEHCCGALCISSKRGWVDGYITTPRNIQEEREKGHQVDSHSF